MFSHADLIDYFDYTHPTPAQIRKKYEKIVDLRKYPVIRDKDIFDAILTLKSSQALVLPNGYGRRLLEVSGYSLDDFDPRTRHLLHWRYAPDVRLNTTAMTVNDAQRTQFTLRGAIRNASWDYHVPHRGFGVVDVRTNEYTLWPFVYIVEGIKMQDLAPQLIRKRTAKGFDVTGTVPSVEEEENYTITLRNVPYMSTGEPYTLATQLHADCNCLWSHYGTRRVEARRYVGGERMMCRHGIAFYKHLTVGSDDRVLDVLPELTGIINPWYTLRQRTIVDNKKLTITRMNSILGMLIAYMGSEKAFSLS